MVRTMTAAQRKQMISLFSLLLAVLLLSSCSFHDTRFSYFNMLDQEKRTLRNRKMAEKFWSSVRPVTTLSASHYKLARYYQQKGKYTRAIEEFSKALQNDGGYCKAYNGIAMSYDALKQCEMAHDAYERGLQCAPGEAYLYNNYGCSSLLCDDFEKALELFTRAAELSGDNKQIRNNLKIAKVGVDRENALSKQIPQTVASPVHVALAAMKAPGEQINVPLIFSDSRQSKNGVAADSVDTGAVAPAGAFTGRTAKIAGQDKSSGERVDQHVAVEVSNGNGVTGMAGRSAEVLRHYGFNIGRITNAPHFRFDESVIFYREGYLQVAKELARVIPGSQEMAKIESLGRAAIGVRVLLGRDLVRARFPESWAGKSYHSEPGNGQLAVMTSTSGQTMAN